MAVYADGTPVTNSTPKMSLEKAIEILSEKVRYEYSASQTDEGDAIKLLIQAGRKILLWRDSNDDDLLLDLPGET